MGSKNLDYEQKQDLNWDPSDVQGSLKKTKEYAEKLAANAIDWYYQRKANKARFSQLFRYGAILFTGLAGLFPVITGAWPNRGGWLGDLRPANADLLVSLFIGIAAVLIAIDRFGGFSTGWIRYIRTAAGIQKALHEYRLEWMKLTAEAGPETKEPENLLVRTREFVVTVQGLVIQETEAWATEFEANLAQMEKSAKEQSEKQAEELRAKPDRPRPGSLFVTVTNLGDLDGYKYDVELFNNEKSLIKATDQVGEWERLGLAPGMYSVRLSAKLGGSSISRTVASTIEAGKPTHKSIELSKAAAAGGA